MIYGDISMHTPQTGTSHWQLKLWVSSLVQLFDFLKIDILCITANFGHFFDILIFDFPLKPPQPSTGLFLPRLPDPVEVNSFSIYDWNKQMQQHAAFLDALSTSLIHIYIKSSNIISQCLSFKTSLVLMWKQFQAEVISWKQLEFYDTDLIKFTDIVESPSALDMQTVVSSDAWIPCLSCCKNSGSRIVYYWQLYVVLHAWLLKRIKSVSL